VLSAPSARILVASIRWGTALACGSATNLTRELYNSKEALNGRDQFGPGNKVIAPVVANGRVYVGTPNGVAAFGLSP